MKTCFQTMDLSNFGNRFFSLLNNFVFYSFQINVELSSKDKLQPFFDGQEFVSDFSFDELPHCRMTPIVIYSLESEAAERNEMVNEMNQKIVRIRSKFIGFDPEKNRTR